MIQFLKCSFHRVPPSSDGHTNVVFFRKWTPNNIQTTISGFTETQIVKQLTFHIKKVRVQVQHITDPYM